MQRNSRRLLVVPVAIVVVGGALVGGAALADIGPFAATADGAPETSGSPSPQPSDPGTATTAPAATTTTAPAAPTAPETSAAPTPPAGKPVDVLLSYAGWDAGRGVVEAAASVAGVVESGGVCTMTLTSGSSTFETTQDALADASTTQCGALTYPGAQLGSGRWDVTVSYRSATSSGASVATAVEVPAR
ncbi:hypothetical protein [Blastococcus tunisiensis]|uniref:Uncharacterized protein n=1 Tax=Blastococcus tunisiensis TaxID=1798228 RepID=A0A1I1WHB0_9ACTN|nr:hypothetical protein [Blastococcus sp. DSM 46838]SFD94527.1 hypothetical protein SAMN05216574_101381 [Blastococcus sp. DSM 46838]